MARLGLFLFLIVEFLSGHVDANGCGWAPLALRAAVPRVPAPADSGPRAPVRALVYLFLS